MDSMFLCDSFKAVLIEAILIVPGSMDNMLIALE